MREKAREIDRLQHKLIDLSTKFLDEVHKVSAWNNSYLRPEVEVEEEEEATDRTHLNRGEIEMSQPVS